MTTDLCPPILTLDLPTASAKDTQMKRLMTKKGRDKWHVWGNLMKEGYILQFIKQTLS